MYRIIFMKQAQKDEKKIAGSGLKNKVLKLFSMQIEKRLNYYYRRWNIEFNDEEQFSKFKNRIIKIINEQIGDYLAKNSNIDKFFKEIWDLDLANKPYVRKQQIIQTTEMNNLFAPPLISDELLKPYRIKTSYTERGFGDTHIYECIDACQNIQELAKIIQFFFWAIETKYDETSNMISEIIKQIRKISLLTPSASFVVHRRDKQVTIYPSGDKFLDQGIIDYTLSGLENYPEVAEHFEKALEIYLHGTTSQYRNLLDDLRFALEQLLKKVLGNKKSLEKQNSDLGSWLKEKGLHTYVRELYQTLLIHYQKYQNDAVKHNEAYSIDEVEFMIYLTGNFMRLLLQLERQKT